MAKTIASEIAKVTKNGAVAGDGFSANVRIRQGINTLRNGDVITFPTDLTGKVIREQMKTRGVPQDHEVIDYGPDGKETGRHREPTMLEYMFVDVDRNGHKTVVPFYPSSFSKSRQLADAVGEEGNGEYERADGEVVDFVTGFDEDEMDKAILAIAAKGKVKVTLRNIIGVDFNTNVGKKMTLPTFTWAV